MRTDELGGSTEGLALPRCFSVAESTRWPRTILSYDGHTNEVVLVAGINSRRYGPRSDQTDLRLQWLAVAENVDLRIYVRMLLVLPARSVLTD